MTEKTTSITVSRRIDAAPSAVFDILSLPAKHQSIDGSGMLRGSDDTERITKSGQVFSMNMFAEFRGGDYRMYNHVSAFDENRMIGWMPAVEPGDTEPGGWEWLWELTPADNGQATEVSLTYDWSKVTDPKLLPLFPAVKREQLEESLSMLAAAATK